MNINQFNYRWDFQEAYRPLVHILQYGTGKETLTIKEVITSAYSKEGELKQKQLTYSEGLYVETHGRTTKRSENGNETRTTRDRDLKVEEGFNQIKGLILNNTCCFICGK